ncbi:hypothetical protein RT41_GL000703 [Lactococcus fujiensis JCM 16395]|uniref:Uncharacterized protein n=2 Tax=Lactococcus fujiensis TaxID=610251 RepID=A0A2A5RNJ4_9LACT|nr:hypothetical protein RT41_GL000703 [Lactococcus fujiensis JCM 16395]
MMRQKYKKGSKKNWWIWMIGILFFPVVCLIGAIKMFWKFKNTGQKRWIIGVIPLALISLFGFIAYGEAFTHPESVPTHETKLAKSLESSPSRTETNSSPSKKSSSSRPSSSQERISSSSISSSVKVPRTSLQTSSSSDDEVFQKLLEYTNAESAGPTQNYYWENGQAKLSGFESLHSGQYSFSSDGQGRSSVARAVLNDSEFKNSQGSRQGDPLAPPYWPTNSKTEISFALTGRTYHGYLYNRSHSIADSLLGVASYTSKFNFTTGTRSQNVGANQNGGMRFPEELVENYWRAHPNTSNTVSYQTRPVYYRDEVIPRGSIVDIKSSDNKIDVEIIVINSAEGISIDYRQTGASNVVTRTRQSSEIPKTSTSTPPSSTITSTEAVPKLSPKPAPAPKPTTSYRQINGWYVANSGTVFVHQKSNRYYSRVKNPSNYFILTLAEAQGRNAVPAKGGNAYAQP